MAMMNVHKMDGYGRYWVVIEMLREQKDYKLKHCQWVTDGLAMAMLCDANSVAQYIDDCINRFELLSSDGEYFWSDSLVRRIEIREEQKEKKREAGRKGAENRWNNGKAMAVPCDTNAVPMANDSKERKVKESKVKESKVNNNKPKIVKRLFGEKVLLTEHEYQKLVSQHGEQETKQMIDILDNWYLTKGKPPNKSDYHTMVGTGWVLKRFNEDKQRQGGSKRYGHDRSQGVPGEDGGTGKKPKYQVHNMYEDS